MAARVGPPPSTGSKVILRAMPSPPPPPTERRVVLRVRRCPPPPPPVNRVRLPGFYSPPPPTGSKVVPRRTYTTKVWVRTGSPDPDRDRRQAVIANGCGHD